jgi:hypothetical protein
MSCARTTIKRGHDCRHVSEDDYSCRFHGAPRARSFSDKLQHRALVTNFYCSNIDTYKKATSDRPKSPTMSYQPTAIYSAGPVEKILRTNALWETGKSSVRSVSEMGEKCIAYLQTTKWQRLPEACCLLCLCRGAKSCDGCNPHETCTRNKTEYKCRSQPLKTVRRDDPPKMLYTVQASLTIPMKPRTMISTERSGSINANSDILHHIVSANNADGLLVESLRPSCSKRRKDTGGEKPQTMSTQRDTVWRSA